MELFGQRVPPEAHVVRRLLADQRTPPERQPAIWIDLWRQWPDPLWGEVCIAEAERVQSLLLRTAALQSQSTNSTPDSSLTPSPDPHFVWLGDRRGILVDHLRDGIAELAAQGLIAADRQAEFRRALGLSVNDAERRTPAAPVPWLGPVDMLCFLVDELWNLGLITCAGGRQQKWRTACATFLRPDGTTFGLTLKNSRCTNPAKRALLESALLGGLRHLSAPTS